MLKRILNARLATSALLAVMPCVANAANDVGTLGFRCETLNNLTLGTVDSAQGTVDLRDLSSSSNGQFGLLRSIYGGGAGVEGEKGAVHYRVEVIAGEAKASRLMRKQPVVSRLCYLYVGAKPVSGVDSSGTRIEQCALSVPIGDDFTIVSTRGQLTDSCTLRLERPKPSKKWKGYYRQRK